MLQSLLKPYRHLSKEIYILGISRFVSAIGALINPFLTMILTQKIGLDSATSGILVGISSIIYIPANLLGGKLCDTIGRKKIAVYFEFLAMLMYVLCALLNPGIAMIGGLFLANLFYSICNPAHNALTADLSQGKQRQGAFSLLYLGFNLGYAVAMIVGGWLFSEHFKLMFLIDAFTTLISLLLIQCFVHEPERDQEDFIDVEKKEEEDKGQQGKRSKQSVWKLLMLQPMLIAFAIFMIGLKITYSQWQFLIPLQTGELFGQAMGSRLYGHLGTLNALIVVIGTPLLTRLTWRRSHIERIILAEITFVIGFGLLGYWMTEIAFMVSACVFTMGEILEAISTMPYIMEHAPSNYRGRVSSVINIIIGLGSSIGPTMAGYIYHKTDFTTTWNSIIVCCLASMAGLILVWIKNKEVDKKRAEAYNKIK